MLAHFLSSFGVHINRNQVSVDSRHLHGNAGVFAGKEYAAQDSFLQKFRMLYSDYAGVCIYTQRRDDWNEVLSMPIRGLEKRS
jgi:hypothetical protein